MKVLGVEQSIYITIVELAAPSSGSTYNVRSLSRGVPVTQGSMCDSGKGMCLPRQSSAVQQAGISGDAILQLILEWKKLKRFLYFFYKLFYGPFSDNFNQQEAIWPIWIHIVSWSLQILESRKGERKSVLCG